ncbi:MAG: hypothetical protein QNJ47_26945 [Nostocaceae cyanobacterium]|nr:hypothetical protein [Nostocaceae cyanobacterium]
MSTSFSEKDFLSTLVCLSTLLEVVINSQQYQEFKASRYYNRLTCNLNNALQKLEQAKDAYAMKLAHGE